jgi:two-component system osmolarity sensor histidine kinase EnvZ
MQVIAATIFFDRHWSKMTERLAYAVAGEIAVLAERIDETPDPAYIADLSAMARDRLGLMLAFLPDEVWDGGKSGKLTYITRKLDFALREQGIANFVIGNDIEEKWFEVRIGLESGVLSVFIPQRRLYSSTGYVFLLWMVFSSIILLVISILFMRNQIRPIRRLAVAAERIGKGRDLPASFKPEGAREVRQASKAFIDMHDRIKRQLAQRTAMLAGVSHDIRTPLTRLKLQVAMMPPSADTEAMKADIHDMERMLNAYLDFVRGEGGEVSQSVDFAVLLDHIVQQARRSGTDIVLECAQGLVANVRPLAFERCINNLIGNARKFARRVWVSAQRDEDDFIRINVEDDGPGIPEDQYEEVFKPFVRVEKSRNAATGGVGLGLSIVQDIVHGHGGEIHLGRSAYGGLAVTIRMPV